MYVEMFYFRISLHINGGQEGKSFEITTIHFGMNVTSKTGFEKAGTNTKLMHFRKECFCGDTAPALSTVLPESECDTRCSGDASQFCGGGWKLSLYGTGITGNCNQIGNHFKDCRRN